MEKFTSFGDLGKFVKEQKPSAVFSDFDAETVYHEIVNALKMGKPRSIEELVKYVSARGYDKITIETAVYFMRNNGVLSCGTVEPVVYWLTIPYSQMTHPTKLPDRGYAPRKQKDPEVLMNTTKHHNIQKGDDLDLAIWKAMQDYKPRSASEIAKILHEYGYDGSITKNRVITLMKRKTWFDRKEKGGQDTKYVLKKTCQNPSLTTDPVDEKDSDTDMKEIPSTLDDLKGTVFYPKTNHQSETHQDANIQMNLSPVIAGKQTINKKTEYTINHRDPIHVAIWKITQDRESYLIDDIIVLVRAAEHFATPGSIRQKISHLNTQYGWFDTKKTDGSGKKIYTLKSNVRDPQTGELMSVVVSKLDEKNDNPVSVNKSTETKVQEKPESIPDEKFTESMPVENVVEPVLIPQLTTQPLLFEVQFKLKGISFSKEDFMEVLKFARSIKGDMEQTNSLIEVSYKIKGVDFTASELKHIVQSFDSLVS